MTGKKCNLTFTLLQKESIEYLLCVLSDILVYSENDETEIYKDKSQIRMILQYFDLGIKYYEM